MLNDLQFTQTKHEIHDAWKKIMLKFGSFVIMTEKDASRTHWDCAVWTIENDVFDNA